MAGGAGEPPASPSVTCGDLWAGRGGCQWPRTAARARPLRRSTPSGRPPGGGRLPTLPRGTPAHPRAPWWRLIFCNETKIVVQKSRLQLRPRLQLQNPRDSGATPIQCDVWYRIGKCGGACLPHNATAREMHCRKKDCSGACLPQLPLAVDTQCYTYYIGFGTESTSGDKTS